LDFPKENFLLLSPILSLFHALRKKFKKIVNRWQEIEQQGGFNRRKGISKQENFLPFCTGEFHRKRLKKRVGENDSGGESHLLPPF
jgi:hypothetical protein